MLVLIPMRYIVPASICLFIFTLTGCAATASFTKTGETYPAYKGPVKVYFEVPDTKYERIGIVSSQGGQIHQRADMIKAMQEKAAENGANAIIIISEKTKENITFAAGQFGAFGGTSTTKNSSALAIRIAADPEGASDSQPQDYEPRWNETFSAGASANGLYFVLDGYGVNAWFGKEKLRFVAEYYAVDTPSALLRDGFANGRAESAYSLEGQYFFLDNLSGPYFSTGFEYTNNSVGHENTVARGAWDDLLFSGGFGYLLRINRYIYIDSKIALNASLIADRTIDVGGREFQPDKAVPSAFIGIGVNF